MTAEFWQYDARIGRRWNVDPVVKEYESPYASIGNNPIWLADYNGADTTLPVAGLGGGNITLPDGVRNIETYGMTDYYFQGTKDKVMSLPGQLRSFSSEVGSFSARWTKGADGIEFAGYQNAAGLDYNTAVDKYNAKMRGDEAIAAFNAYMADPINQVMLIAFPLQLQQAQFQSGNPAAGNTSVVLRSEMQGVLRTEFSLYSKMAAEQEANAVLTFSKNATYPTGTFSVLRWDGYPAGAAKPTGPFRLLEGLEYTTARKLANKTNAALHAANPQLRGLQIHELHPVKFGGSPTDLSNKIYLSPADHAKYTNYWNWLMRSIK